MANATELSAADRLEHRGAARDLRANAGLEQGGTHAAVAEIGAAARRLRQSNRWVDAPLRVDPQPAVPVRPVLVRVAGGEGADPARAAHPAGAARVLPRRLRLV